MSQARTVMIMKAWTAHFCGKTVSMANIISSIEFSIVWTSKVRLTGKDLIECINGKQTLNKTLRFSSYPSTRGRRCFVFS